jgi:hypothetical protein
MPLLMTGSSLQVIDQTKSTFGALAAQHAARRLGRFLGDAAEAQLTAGNSHFLQIFEYLLWHALRLVDVTMILSNIDAPNVHALDAGLICDGADDVAGLDPMYRPDLETKSFHLRRS